MTINQKYLYFSLHQLLENKVHIGHKNTYWKRQTAAYLFGVRKSICLFKLKPIFLYAKRAVSFLEHTVFNYGKLFFIGGSPEINYFIKQLAEGQALPYTIKLWLGGTFTNWFIIKGFLDSLNKHSFIEKRLQFKTKRQRKTKLKQYAKFQDRLIGFKALPAIPEVIITLNAKYAKNAVKECLSLSLPVIMIADSNIVPLNIPYFIPGNDDSFESLNFFCNLFKFAMKEGKAQRKLHFLKPCIFREHKPKQVKLKKRIKKAHATAMKMFIKKIKK